MKANAFRILQTLCSRAPPVGAFASRGTPHTSAQLARFAHGHNLTRSVGRTGVWDNAQAESFWATMKVEFYDQYLWPVRADAGRAVGDWIERVYNRHRRHWPSVWSARSSTKTDSIRRHKPPDPVSAKRGQAQSIPAPTQQALRTLEWVLWRENLICSGPSGNCITFLPGLHVDRFPPPPQPGIARRAGAATACRPSPRPTPGLCVRTRSRPWSPTSGCWPWSPTT